MITHHLPSFKSVAEKYKYSELTAGFASNLDHILEHTHTNIDYTHSDTRVLCNPRGYVQYGTKENPAFNHDLIVDFV